MSTPTKLLVALLIVVSSISYYLVPNASVDKRSESFAQLDSNSDGYVDATEFPDANRDYLDHADQDFDGLLSQREFRGYANIGERVVAERARIPTDVREVADIRYVENGHARQRLDLYLPANHNAANPVPLVIWIHGGGWRKGTKLLFGQQAELLKLGFAVASINYRLSQHAPFPAQIHDGNAAIRYLRKNSEKLGIDPERFGIWGASAGGHIAALVALGNNDLELEGAIGVTGVSSRVQATALWFAPTEMISMYDYLAKQHPPGTDLSGYEVPMLFRGSSDELPNLYALGSPMTHANHDDPPFLLMHGAIDPLVPLQQSRQLHERLLQSDVASEMHTIPGAKHNFFRSEREHELVHEFFVRNLK